MEWLLRRFLLMPRSILPTIEADCWGCQSLVMMFHWTVVRPSSRGVVEDVGTASSVGWAEEVNGGSERVFNGYVGGAELLADAGVGLNVQPGVGHGVVADDVPGAGNGLDDAGLLADEAGR